MHRGKHKSLKRPALPAPAERRRGFSLLEMLVAAVVLAVGLVIVTESISAGLSAAARTERRFFAGRLAADRLNRAASGAFAALPQEGEARVAGVAYCWRVEPAPRQDGLASLRCIVEWTGRGQRHTATLSRAVAAEEGGAAR